MEENTSFIIIIYYYRPKTSNLIIKNNSRTTTPVLQTIHVVYKYTCNFQNYKSEYIDIRQLTLEKKLDSRLLQWQHQEPQCYNITPTKVALYNNTKIIKKERNYRSLAIKEYLLIQQQPDINIQQNNYHNVLKLNQTRNNYNIQDRQRGETQ